MEYFLFLFFYFFLFSILGYLCEIMHCFIIQKRFTLSRGFFLGPYCPIYGMSVLLLFFVFSKIERNTFSAPFLVFTLAFFLCSSIEYISSLLLEKIFKLRWWDYSDRKWNIKGRVCFSNAVLFGLGGLFLYFYLFPCLKFFIQNSNRKILLLLSALFFILFVTDVTLTITTMYHLQISKKRFEEKDVTPKINPMIRKTIFQAMHVKFSLPPILNLKMPSIAKLREAKENKRSHL